MKRKNILGIFIILVFSAFEICQQTSQNQECLQKAHQFKDSVFVLLDPGHGGPSNNGRTCTGGDPGAIGHHNKVEYHEACMTTDLALGVREILLGLGLDIGMTRDTNVSQSNDLKAQEIREQVLDAKYKKGDIFNPYFISIHFNASDNIDANGNYGIYAHSNKAGEIVPSIVSDATNTSFLDSCWAPRSLTYPEVTLVDNQNVLFNTLNRNLRLVLGGTERNNREELGTDGKKVKS